MIKRLINTARNWSKQRSYRRFMNKQFPAIFQSIRRGDVVIDCGANIGAVTEQLAATGASVYAFEPNPYAFIALSARFSGVPNVECIQKAVWTDNTQLPLYLHERTAEDPVKWSTASSMMAAKDNVGNGAETVIDTVDLSEFILTLAAPVTLIKMDIEGAEYSVIPALVKSGAMAQVHHLLVETHAEKYPALSSQHEALLALIEQEGLQSKINLTWR